MKDADKFCSLVKLRNTSNRNFWQSACFSLYFTTPSSFSTLKILIKSLIWMMRPPGTEKSERPRKFKISFPPNVKSTRLKWFVSIWQFYCLIKLWLSGLMMITQTTLKLNRTFSKQKRLSLYTQLWNSWRSNKGQQFCLLLITWSKFNVSVYCLHCDWRAILNEQLHKIQLT